ncbi:MAG TPA: S41 family peptidase [Opitutaceae bacterium]|nr:S41 family peptidase [Opitutaceae bacterium]
MFKRILHVGLVVLLVANTALLALQYAERYGWLAGKDSAAQARRFREVTDAIAARYVDPAAATPEKLTTTALEEMVRRLDPHSEFLEAKEYASVQGDLRSEFGGVGVQIELRDEKVIVIAPIAGTPGERAGILRGDRIAKVDGRELASPVMRDAVERLRGKPGTKVRVGLERGENGSTRELELEVVREIIKVETIREARLVAPGIGYIQLTQFTERTAVEFRAALEKLEAQGLNGLVLDLRNNPGGLLTSAVEVLAPFFRDGELAVYTQGREASSRAELRTHGGGRPRHYPIAVLVNSGSASAAEIVTGALRDTRRAVVIGERTFGKGSVQTLVPLDRGEALRLTTARYFTPGGQVIHGQGIEPDVLLPVSAEDDRKLGIQRLRNDFATPEEFKARFDFEPIADRQLETALDVLRGVLAYGGGVNQETATAATQP